MEPNPIAKGFYFDKPREGAPEFIKARIGVNVEQAIELLQTYKNESGYVNLELLKKKDGSGHYLQVNTYGLPMPKESAPKDESWRNENIANTSVPYPDGKETGTSEPVVPEITDDDIPF